MASDRASNAQAIASGIAVVISIGSLFYAHNANSISNESNRIAAEANEIAEESAERQGAVLIMDRAKIRLRDRETGVWRDVPGEGVGDNVNVPGGLWESSDWRIVSVTVRNDGQLPAHLSQSMLLVNERGEGVYGDAVKPRCADGPAPWGPCPEVLQPNEATIMHMDLSADYLTQVEPAYQDRGVVVCIYAGGLQKTLETGLILPAAAYGP